MEPRSCVDRVISRRCALLGAGGVGAAAVLAACGGSSGSGPTAASSVALSAASSAPPSSAAPASSAASSAPASSAASSAAPADAIARLSDVPVGGTAAVTVGGASVLLSQPSAGQVDAFSSRCPHQGGQVRPDGAIFKCSLHGSEFSATGAVQQGPATRDLTAVPVRVVGDAIVQG